ncbi:MAG: hypothetical protein DRP11_05085 [Candidatus Aenigmatarchaeota archaeon]|nr:MAG: hypothetical protein DRP11_05085 [Candidatus Aenigmarchaeota archaeon]
MPKKKDINAIIQDVDKKLRKMFGRIEIKYKEGELVAKGKAELAKGLRKIADDLEKKKSGKKK